MQESHRALQDELVDAGKVRCCAMVEEKRGGLQSLALGGIPCLCGSHSICKGGKTWGRSADNGAYRCAILSSL